MPKYWLIGGGAFVGLLLVASVVVALTQGEDTLPDGTSERAVQLYIQAVRDDDFEGAHALMSEELKEECPVETLAARSFGGGREARDSRVTLRDSRTFDDTAVVTAEVTRIRGSGPFGTSESSHEQRYTLVQEDGQWRLSRASGSSFGGPWPYYSCRDPEPFRAPAPPAPVATPTPAS